ncbi:MAG: tRNA pseudouridine(38-40) synthase TruA [Proteobacteria bacterium]|nr:tRNA pseudouridine(38-40) synthase TruA [Pseudomonadota bacterium]
MDHSESMSGGPFFWRLELCWDGTDWSGWQRQPSVPTIQEAVEEVLKRIVGETIAVMAAGRTDAGVHASHQVSSFQTKKNIDPSIVLRGMNALLPQSILILRLELAPKGFHARLWSTKKLYRYRWITGQRKCPFRSRYAWVWGQELDFELMSSVVPLFVGQHDMSGFRAQGCTAKSTVRTIESARLFYQDDELHFEIEGNGFLRHQVRIMAGTLFDIGRGKIPADRVQELLDHGDRRRGGRTAPPQGLWLIKSWVANSPRAV